MEATTLPWLDGAVETVSTTAIVLLVALNGLFAATLFLGRDRRFVNRWTKPLLVTDAALLMAAFGAPVAAIAINLGAKGAAVIAGAAARALPAK